MDKFTMRISNPRSYELLMLLDLVKDQIMEDGIDDSQIKGFKFNHDIVEIYLESELEDWEMDLMVGDGHLLSGRIEFLKDEA